MTWVPEVGLEPTRPFEQRILSPSRLPFRHSGQDRQAYREDSGQPYLRVVRFVTPLPSKVFTPCSRSLFPDKDPKDPEWVAHGSDMRVGNS